MNYKKAIEDFNNGTIDPKKWQLVMDNDSGYWLCIDPKVEEDDDLLDKLTDQMTKKYGKPDGYNDIVDVLVASGVNCDWC